MRLWSISLRNLRVRLVATVLTTASIVVATALYAAILVMAEQTEARYKGSIGGYQAVVGPKDASQLELVLNTIFNVGEAPGLFPLQVAIDLRAGKVSRRGQVRYAIPQARGDSVSRHGFPVVATLDEMFTAYEWHGAPLPFAAGGPFRFSWDELLQLGEELAAYENGRRAGEAQPPPRPLLRPAWRQAVVGSRVARTLELGLGSTITPVHGKMGEFGYHEHPEASCEVVGILAPTNSPLDTTIFLPLGTHLLIDGHEAGVFVVEIPPGKTPDDAKRLPVSAARIGLTAIVVDPKDHFGARILRTEFGARADAQVAWPQDVVPRFLRDIGNAADVLTVIAWLVLLVASVSITVAIYNTMNERRREIAIMRSLGARRLQILAIITGEAALLSLFGAVLGVLVCHLAALLLRATVEDMTGVHLDWLQFRPWEAWLVFGVTGVGALAGLAPAVKGSLTQVADNLAQDY
ncbi:MAG: ABC transporter permease [Planctomycetes bacterium]|nr:ABC transporter permease [Planctomycetota bacterium]